MALSRTSGQGRPKGTPNRFNRTIKEMVELALRKAGGVDYLARQAEENPVAFMGLVGRVMPLQVTGSDGGALLIDFRWADSPTPTQTVVADETTATAEITDVTWSDISEC